MFKVGAKTFNFHLPVNFKNVFILMKIRFFKCFLVDENQKEVKDK